MSVERQTIRRLRSTQQMAANTKTPNDDDRDEHRPTTFRGEYPAYGTTGRTTSDPTTLVWLDGYDGKFGLHHPEEYQASQVVAWLLEAVDANTDFMSVANRPRESNITLVVHLSPNVEPEYIPAEDIFLG